MWIIPNIEDSTKYFKCIFYLLLAISLLDIIILFYIWMEETELDKH